MVGGKSRLLLCPIFNHLPCKFSFLLRVSLIFLFLQIQIILNCILDIVNVMLLKLWILLYSSYDWYYFCLFILL